MKPNFALTLSFEGIRLLHRSPSGWIVVGEVPLDEPNLAGALASMRATAVELEPGGIRTKVMLPAEQVKLLDAPEPGEAAARAALEGATPYAVADLVVDHVTVDGRHRVAAVARETLEEAEAFAAGHRFHPVSFAAVLPGGGFPGEAFFGETRLGRSGAERVERDALPTVPRAARAAREEDRPAAASTALGTDGFARSAPDAAAAGSLDAAPGGVASPDLALRPSAAEAPLSTTGIPEPVFASRSRIVPDRELPAPEQSGLSQASRRDDLPRTDAPPPRGAEVSAPRDERRTEPPVRAAAPMPEPHDGPGVPQPSPAPRSPVVPAPPAIAAAPVAAAASVPEPVLAAAAPDPRRSTQKAAEPARSRGKPRFLGLVLTAVLLLAMLAVGVLASSSQQRVAGLLGLADEQSPAASSLSAATSAPATEPRSAPAPAPIEAAPRPAPAVAEAAPANLTPEEAADAVAAVAAAVEALPEPQPVPEVARGTPVSPADVDRIHAAKGVWLGSPLLSAPPQVGAVTLEVSSATETSRPGWTAPATLVQVVADAGLVRPDLPPAPRAAPVRAPAPETAEPEETVIPATVAALAEAPPVLPPTRQPPTSPEAEAAPPATPNAAALATFANAMAVPPGQRPATRPADPALPEAMRVAVAPSGAPEGQPGAVPGGATAAAVVQLSGPPAALAFAGNPTEDAPATAEAAPGSVGLDAFEGARPPLRPDGLAPEAPEALAVFDGPRPGLRPDGLAPGQAAEAPVVAEDAATDPDAIASAVAAAQAAAPPAAAPALPQVDVQSALASIVAGGPDPLAGATRQAVAVARVPDARPRNFDRVVRDQLSRTARAAPAAAPQAASPEEAESTGTEVASAAAVPSGATAQSVAQAATFADVMAMREVNLIGVFGQPSDRRALVRTGNGRYVRVGVGDSLDGGRVTAIGDNALNYTKRGRQLQLVIPGG